MSRISAIAAVLLAAGESRRYGSAKLAADLAGIPVVHHAALTIRALPFARHIAVVSHDDYGLAALGFELVRVSSDAQPMSASLAAGLASITDPAIEGALVALGDTPFVSADHLIRLAATFDGSRIASKANGVVMPPAIFGRSYWQKIASIEGDLGARSLLQDAMCLGVGDNSLFDIDTLADIECARTNPKPANLG
jgi:molybdenum cofactor cytidylyltransferase